MKIMQLPDVVLDEIFSHLSYDEISKSRLVSQAWNNKCKEILTRGFYSVEKFHAQRYKDVKSRLPRRESERRNHVLARHCDILTAIETRLSMLSMTFTKYIDVGLCCFIPGKVIDEIFRVLKFIKDMQCPPRAHEILQELRDLSSMAMEHFDEKIVPSLKETIALAQAYPITGGPRMVRNQVICASSCPTTVPRLVQRPPRLEQRSNLATAVQHFRSALVTHSAKVQRSRLANRILKRKFDDYKLKMRQQYRHLWTQNRKLTTRLGDLEGKLILQDKTVKDQDASIAELKRVLEEFEHKMTDLNAKLSRVPEPDVEPVQTRKRTRQQSTVVNTTITKKTRAK